MTSLLACTDQEVDGGGGGVGQGQDPPGKITSCYIGIIVLEKEKDPGWAPWDKYCFSKEA